MKDFNEKWYIIGTVVGIFAGIAIGWLKRQELIWYNIIHDHGNTFGLSKTMSAAYKTEEGALKIIEDYKNKDVIEEGNKVKSITYKMID